MPKALVPLPYAGWMKRVTSSGARLARIVFLRGHRYGSAVDTPYVTRAATESAIGKQFTVLGDQAMNVRSIVPAGILDHSAIKVDADGSCEWTFKAHLSQFEYAQWSIGQECATAIVDPDVLFTPYVGHRTDGMSGSGLKAGSTACRKQVYDRGSSLAGETWTFSCYVRRRDEDYGQSLSVSGGIAIGDENWTEKAETTISFTNVDPPGWIRFSATRTFTGSSTKIQVRLLTVQNQVFYFSRAQLEGPGVASPTGYERNYTSPTGASRNRLCWSDWPIRTALESSGTNPWSTAALSTGATLTKYEYAGPPMEFENYAYGVPIAGTIAYAPRLQQLGWAIGDQNYTLAWTLSPDNTACRMTVVGASEAKVSQLSIPDIDLLSVDRMFYVCVHVKRGYSPSVPTNYAFKLEFLNSSGVVQQTHDSPSYVGTDAIPMWRREWFACSATADATVDRLRVSLVIPAGNDTKYMDFTGVWVMTHGSFPHRIHEERTDQHILNGNMDGWAAGNPNNWTKVLTSGSVTQESTIVKSGSSLKYSGKTGAGENWIEQVYQVPNRWERTQLVINYRIAQTESSAVRVRIRHDASNTWLKSDGSWQATPVDCITQSPTAGVWTRHASLTWWYSKYNSGGEPIVEDNDYFTVQILFGLSATVTASQAWYIDDLQIRPTNLIKDSEDISTANWTATNCTVAKNQYAPAYRGTIDVAERGTCAPQPFDPTIADDCEDSEGFYDSTSTSGDRIQGNLYSVGSYFATQDGDALAGAGDFDAFPTGWTTQTNSGQAVFTKVTVPYAMENESSASASYALEYKVVTSGTTGQTYIEKSVTLERGWNSIIVRMRGTKPNIQVQRVSDSFYLQVNASTWSASSFWTEPEGGSGTSPASNSGNQWDLYVLHFYAETSAAHLVRISYKAAGTGYLDRVYVLKRAGEIRPSGDHQWMAFPTSGTLRGMYIQGVGVVSDVTRADEATATFQVKGSLKASKQEVPARKTTPECPWTFMGAECGYEGITATVAADSTGTTVTVDTTSLIEPPQASLPSGSEGRALLVWETRGSNTPPPTVMRVASIVSSTQFTILANATLTKGQRLVYADCRRTTLDCTWRTNTRRYGGFPGTVQSRENGVWSPTQPTKAALFASWFAGRPITYVTNAGVLYKPFPDLETTNAAGRARVFEENPVPVIYGRTTSRCVPVDASIQDIDGASYVTAIYLIGEGEIEEVRNLWTDQGPVFALTGSTTHAVYKGQSWQVHKGLEGDGTLMTVADWNTNRATRNLSTQTVDIRAFHEIPYHRRAYVAWQQKASADSGPNGTMPDLPEFWADVKGLKVQKYTDTGALDGSPVWSQNPVWCLIDMLTNRRYGMGFPKSNLYWAKIKAVADACDAVWYPQEAYTSLAVAASNSTTLEVSDVIGFAPEMSLVLSFSTLQRPASISEGSNYFGSSATSYVGFTNDANTWDSDDSTFGYGQGKGTYGSPNTYEYATIKINTVGWTGTRNVRGAMKVGISGSKPAEGQVLLYYSTNSGSTWTLFQTVTTASPSWYYTPQLTQVNVANLRLGAEVRCNAPSLLRPASISEGTNYFGSSATSYVGFTDDAKTWDSDEATFGYGTAVGTYGTPSTYQYATIKMNTVSWTGTLNIKGAIKVGISGANPTQGSVLLYYSTNSGSSWTLFQTVTSATPAWYYTADLASIDVSAFRLGVEVRCNAPGSTGSYTANGDVYDWGYQDRGSYTANGDVYDVGYQEGGEYDAVIANVVNVTKQLILKVPVSADIGTTVQAKTKLYTFNMAFPKAMKPSDALQVFLDTFRGRWIWDSGKLGLAIDYDLSDAKLTVAGSSGTVSDTVPDSFKADKLDASKLINRMLVGYTRGGTVFGDAGVTEFSDFSSGAGDTPRTAYIDIPAAETPEHALRCGLARYARMGIQNSRPPFTVTAMPSGQLAQIGDKFQYHTKSASMATTSYTGRIAAVTYNPDMTVVVEAHPEISSLQSDTYSPAINLWTGRQDVSRRREAGRRISNGSITISATLQDGGKVVLAVSLAGFTELPASSGRKFQAFRKRLELHASETAGFTPDIGGNAYSGTGFGEYPLSTSQILWSVPDSLINKTIYVKVIAVRAGGLAIAAISNELTLYVSRVSSADTDPTIQQASSPYNLVYGGDFDDTTHALLPWEGPATGTSALTNADENTDGGDIFGTATADTYGVMTNIANAYDNDTDYANATCTCVTTGFEIYTLTWRTGEVHDTAWSGTKTVRIVVDCEITGGTNPEMGSIALFYSTNGGTSWTQWYTHTGSRATRKSGWFTGVNIANLRIGWEGRIQAVDMPNGTYTAGFRVYYASAEEQTATTVGSIGSNIATIQGDGTVYGYVRHKFPGKAGPTGTHIVANTTNVVRIMLRYTGATPDTNKPVEIRIYDTGSAASWELDSIPATEITTSWQGFARDFTPTTPVTGALYIEVRTKNTKPIQCDKLGVWRGQHITAWTPSVDDQNDGVFGDFSVGEARSFTRGPWAGSRKKSSVS